MKRAVAVIVIAVAIAVGALTSYSPVQAASQGAGFGTWAPVSAYGWHGSMLINGAYTYCIRPGLPAPTGQSTDNGVSGTAAGLSPAQLTGINLLVSKYGQTSDPVQAASVGWAVKAVADWNETLHAYGYPGDTLQGAINWTFSALAPESNAVVQQLAASYYAEAMSAGTGALGGSGTLIFTTDPADPSRGTVTAVTDIAGVSGSVQLDGAVFVDSGSASRDGVTPGTAFDIVTTEHQATFRVRGTGTFRGGYQAAVRHYTTSGGQDTAGAGGFTEFSVARQDAADRVTTFAPVITTQVASRYVESGPFVDDVTFTTARGIWPRASDGRYVTVAATGTVYRTSHEPSTGAVPPEAEMVAQLAVTTLPETGATVPYRVQSETGLAGPGFYTAVWQIRVEAQSPETVSFLEPGYSWTEPFGEQTQIMIIPAISSRAEPVVPVGATMKDEVVVEGPVPAAGLDVTTAVYRSVDGLAPADSCTPETLVWSNAGAPVRVTSAGTTTITAPVVPDFGTYFWRERAVDSEGRLVHEGPCGVEGETTRAPLPTVTTRAGASPGFGGGVSDVATVSGPVPQTGRTVLTFDLYRVLDPADPASACTPGNLVGDTLTDPIAVTAAGSYSSPELRPGAAGIFAWIERLWHTRDGETEARLLTEGACGAPDETVVMQAPAVVTTATARAATDEPFTDTATIEGLAPDAEAQLVFFAYRTPLDASPVCTEETLLAETAAVVVRGDGEYVSPHVRSDRTGIVYWIAELRYAGEGAVMANIHRGECGEEHESTTVEALAATGPGAGIPILPMGALGAAIVTLGAALAVAFRRRRHGARG
ncbi:hypothetical protein [Microbacterium rhizomatis]|uniref:VaFE repeat-containing surface-anchored protein n=1 Tax=Microbacterium rhizomatis TaxID=1631477 RepID=A0A5J5IZU2_9MICO|nr:hypothetical protein [Microbacterium rhizomatis]KAA9107577.1 hypothetical protein F6B43_08900 [Microbacterium rhizomatis]